MKKIVENDIFIFLINIKCIKFIISFFKKTIVEFWSGLFHTESYRETHQTGSKQCASGDKESSYLLGYLEWLRRS